MRRILIVEDEPRIASFLDKGLRANGFTTSIAVDGPEALLRADSDEFDLAVLDLGLPGMDGAEVLRRLRAAGSRLPVIILTARDQVRDRIAGLEGGADDYVTKPFSFQELLARVRTRLRGSGVVEETCCAVGTSCLTCARAACRSASTPWN